MWCVYECVYVCVCVCVCVCVSVPLQFLIHLPHFYGTWYVYCVIFNCRSLILNIIGNNNNKAVVDIYDVEAIGLLVPSYRSPSTKL
jgi:hypothetical protein